MNIFCIVVIYNGTQNNWIKNCFSSILNSSIPITIIAVDNNSNDDSTSYIKTHFPEVQLIECEENLGFGKANNIGIEIALKNNCDFVFLLNQDARVNPDTIQKLALKLKQNPDFGIISPMHLNGTGSALDYNFSNYIIPSYCKNLYSDFVLNKVADKVYESDFICAAAWLLSRRCLEIVGGFNPTFFHYGEDDNYVHRLHYKGLKIGVDPFSTMYHDRENRGANDHHQDRSKIEERTILLKYSNPTNQYNIAGEKKHLKRILLKSKLLNQTDTIRYIKNRISLINLHANQIIKNLNISKSDEKFIFLNFDAN